MPLKRLPNDGRAYLTVGDSAHHLGITVGALRLLYGDGMIQCYSKSMSRNKPYLFALTDLESLASKGNYCTLTDLESLALARIDP